MKVIALKTTHGRYGLKKKGDVFDVSERLYKELTEKKIKHGKRPVVKKYSPGASKRQTKEDKAANSRSDKSYKQNGSWFYVYENGEVIDKFQGSEGLEKHGLKQ